MTMIMAKTIITKIIITIMMRMRIKKWKSYENIKASEQNKSVEVKEIHIC